MRPVYRITQGIGNLFARMGRADWRLVEAQLSAAEWSLFAGMQTADQLHSVRVMRSLLDDGVDDPMLLKAALLHDVGKSRCRIGIVHRTLYVLLKDSLAKVPDVIALQSMGRLWAPFYVIANHAQIGAAMLAKAGCDERVWRLTELHQTDPADIGAFSDDGWVRQSLVALRRADNRN